MSIIKEKNIYFPLPFEIIQIVMSYAQSPQPKKLLRDIQSFHETRSLAFDVYYKEWIIQWGDDHLEDKNWFINDIILFANGYQGTNLGYIDDFYGYFLRNPRLQNREQVDKYLFKLEEKSVQTQINLFWGLFTPMERKKMLLECLASVIIQQENEE